MTTKLYQECQICYINSYMWSITFCIIQLHRVTWWTKNNKEEAALSSEEEDEEEETEKETETAEASETKCMWHNTTMFMRYTIHMCHNGFT
jgi:hypothetical protein